VSHPIRRLHDLAECCVFGKQSVDPFHCDPLLSASSIRKSEFRIRISKHSCLFRASTFVLRVSSFLPAAKRRGHPFFRSYGARLPSSLTRFHSHALAQLCPPTCVGLRYGRPWEHPEGFLGSCFNGSASAEASTSLPLRADRHFQSATHFHRNVTSELNHSRCRNIKPAVHRLRPSAST
jgi:hypothetical protein